MWGLCSSLCSTWSKNSLAVRGCIHFDVLEMKGKRYDCANYAGSLYVLAVFELRTRAVAMGGEQRPSLVLQGKAPSSPVLFIFVFKSFWGMLGQSFAFEGCSGQPECIFGVLNPKRGVL